MGEREKKSRVLVVIDPDVNRRFRELITNKYKTYEKGRLSVEIELAMRDWLNKHKDTQKPLTRKQFGDPKIKLVWDQVCDFLTEGYYPDGIQQDMFINGNHLERAIRVIRGGDPRTIDRWKEDFVSNRFIRDAVGINWRVL